MNELFDTATTRSRARALLTRARAGQSAHFTVHDDALASVANLVAQTTRSRYPDLKIPYHSRWRHFEAGGVNRRAWLDEITAGASQDAVTLIDLVVVSVLLDAGAGASWQYKEARTGQIHARSEGLGVASFHAFCSGLFSSDPAQPLRVDAAGLQHLSTMQLAQAFQVTDSNPLVGLEGRVNLLRRLGKALAEQPEVFGKPERVGNLYGFSLVAGKESAQSATDSIAAHDLLALLLKTLSRIWPSGSVFDAQAIGDCWPHAALGRSDTTEGWMPFHKLSQWLTYSLLEPFEWSGTPVTGLDRLTGLPEYRNGGLLLDGGVLALKNKEMMQIAHHPSEEFIVEWRALTVALLDELVPLVRQQLGLTEAQMPLACVLEGGTWAAGRVLAQQLRGGTPPFPIDSDGTIF
ncbi:URC4/urg3 family protein [Variovorax sp. PCZ-1]|uniref:URC4/urg3 family protein n=1 Tax=Variovorax sp. PCZ-1 TaxID=2835533 RepID=UPI001BCE7E83|nr:URC4/urg3 family protein [Variovorax sp. PCZ-1]MBS7807035.1 URC4/urg3 family protein [Variovorax sp. PCZ-1]